jgi:acyl-CoA thioesterase-1
LVLNRRDFILTTAALGSAGAWAAAAQAQTATAGKPVILVLGDSLSAEYGLKRGEGWVPLLEKRLVQQKIAATVVNASISGDTSSGGRARFAALLAQHKPSHVVLELGANDACAACRSPTPKTTCCRSPRPRRPRAPRC